MLALNEKIKDITSMALLYGRVIDDCKNNGDSCENGKKLSTREFNSKATLAHDNNSNIATNHQNAFAPSSTDTLLTSVLLRTKRKLKKYNCNKSLSRKLLTALEECYESNILVFKNLIVALDIATMNLMDKFCQLMEYSILEVTPVVMKMYGEITDRLKIGGSIILCDQDRISSEAYDSLARYIRSTNALVLSLYFYYIEKRFGVAPQVDQYIARIEGISELQRKRQIKKMMSLLAKITQTGENSEDLLTSAMKLS